jgi:MFS family permease
LTIIKDKRLFSLFFSTLLVFTSFTSFFPVLPLYLRELGSSNFMVGIVMSSFPIGVLLFRPAVSWALEKKGRRWTLMAGTMALSLTTALYILVPNPQWLIVVRFFHGIGISAFTTASIVLISDLTTHENRGEVMGLMVVANYVGFGVGPFFASRLYDWISINSVFIFATVTAVLSFLVLLLISHEEEHVSDKQIKQSFFETINKRWIIVPNILILVASLVQGSIVMFMPVFLKEVAQLDSGLFFLLFSFSALLIRIIAGKAADLYGRGIVVFVASLFIGASLISLWLTRSYYVLFLSAILYGIGYGSQQPTMSAYVADNTSYQNRSTIFGLYYAVFDVGVLSSGYIFGAISDYSSINHIFPIAFIIYICAILLFLTQIQSTIKKSITWIFTLRSCGKVCRICNNQIGIDPCHICGHRGGFAKSPPK